MTVEEALTYNFYLWEIRGRGYLYLDEVADLEPPFYPFTHNYILNHLPQEKIDDGRYPSFLEGLGKLITYPFRKAQQPTILDENLIPFPDSRPLKKISENLIELQLKLPKGESKGLEPMYDLLVMLTACFYHLSFELIGTHKEIIFQIVCDAHDESFVTGNIKTFFPSIIFNRKVNFLKGQLIDKDSVTICHYNLKEEFMRPLSTTMKHSRDPFMGIYSVLEQVGEGEMVFLQILFKGTELPWSQSIKSAVHDFEGNPFFIDDPHLHKLATDKISDPLFAATVRIVVDCINENRTARFFDAMEKGLLGIEKDGHNSLVPAVHDLPFDSIYGDLTNRSSHFYGMVLNARELANLVHFPLGEITLPKLNTPITKTKFLQSTDPKNEYVLGTNVHLGVSKLVSLSIEERLRHVHLIGATGSGKSNLMKNLIVQDMKNGQSLTLLDPHGDLVNDVISHIPEHRLKDVILIDPSNTDYSVGLNLLSAKTEAEKIVLSSDLVATFERRSTSWGDQMSSVLGNAIDAFLNSSQGGSLYDLRNFLIEDDYRKSFLKTVEDQSIVYFWEKQFPLQRKGTIPSLLTRLDTFLRPKIIRHMMMQKDGVNFGQVMNENKILLIKLSQGLIGEENSSLLGTMIISKINQAAQGRQTLKQGERKPHFLYIDEFYNFTTPSIAQILSGARKYSLGLICAHQSIRQVQVRDREVANSIINNPYTRVCFRCGEDDADKLKSGFSYFDDSDIQNLPVGRALVRVGKRDNDGNVATALLEKLPEEVKQKKERIISDNTKEAYGKSIDELYALQKVGYAATEKPAIISDIDKPIIEEIQSPIEVEGSIKLENPGDEDSITATEIVEKLDKKRTDREHTLLQTFVKKTANERGFKATIEEPTSDGGRVDVGLLMNELSIACEISVTNKTDYEVQNIQKCFDANYNYVIVISNDAKHLRAIRKLAIEKIDSNLHPNLIFTNQENFIFELDSILSKLTIKTTTKKVRGYRVHITQNPKGDGKSVMDALKDTVKEAMKRKGTKE